MSPLNLPMLFASFLLSGQPEAEVATPTLDASKEMQQIEITDQYPSPEVTPSAELAVWPTIDSIGFYKVGTINGYMKFGAGDHRKDLNRRNLLKLRAELWDQLFLDKFLQSEVEAVSIKFQEDKLLVNNQELSSAQAANYRIILSKYQVAPSANRQIQMSGYYTAVGDFVGDDFKGVGYGYFQGWISQQEVQNNTSRYTSWL